MSESEKHSAGDGLDSDKLFGVQTLAVKNAPSLAHHLGKPFCGGTLRALSLGHVMEEADILRDALQDISESPDRVAAKIAQAAIDEADALMSKPDSK